MFDRFKTAVKLTALFLILGLCAWLWHQSNVISDLKAVNQTQARAITQQSAVISRLKFEATENRRITLELSKVESDARRQSDEILKSIPSEDKASRAFGTRAPRNVIEFLRK